MVNDFLEWLVVAARSCGVGGLPHRPATTETRDICRERERERERERARESGVECEESGCGWEPGGSWGG